MKGVCVCVCVCVYVLSERIRLFNQWGQERERMSSGQCALTPLCSWPISLQVHLRSARRLCELCCANRGTFIKVGQHLGALDYLLPEEYTSTLKVLHSQAPQSSMQEVRRVIREDLGKEVAARAGSDGGWDGMLLRPWQSCPCWLLGLHPWNGNILRGNFQQ